MFSRSNLMLPQTFLPMLAQATSRKNMTQLFGIGGIAGFGKTNWRRQQTLTIIQDAHFEKARGLTLVQTLWCRWAWRLRKQKCMGVGRGVGGDGGEDVERG